MDHTELSRLAAEVTKPPPVVEERGFWQSLLRQFAAANSTAALKAETAEIYAKGDKIAAHLITQQYVLKQMVGVQTSDQFLRFLELLDTVPADLRPVLIEQEMKSRSALLALERIEAEREAVRQQTTTSRPPGLIPPEALEALADTETGAEPGEHAPAIEPFITSEQIEATATRLFRRYCALPPVQAVEELSKWGLAMRPHIPATVISEVTENVERKLRMLG